MPNFPKKLTRKLDERAANNSLRSLKVQENLVDFSSNDYLGLSKEPFLNNDENHASSVKSLGHGATGSRLLSGNHPIHQELERFLEDYYGQKGALLFNSGYDANIGFFSSVPQRGDFVFYDELVHASIRDGIKMGDAKAFKFKHNDLKDLKLRIERAIGTGNPQFVEGACPEPFEGDSRTPNTEIYVVTESVFSMDGDSPDLKVLATFCERNNILLVVDEAHAVGVFGKGLLGQLKLKEKVFAQLITFGKAMGCHGAAILGSTDLKTYLINFARSFIYTTALAPQTAAHCLATFEYLKTAEGVERQLQLQNNIDFFRKAIVDFELQDLFLPSNSAIQIALFQGNDKVKKIAQILVTNGFDIRAILSPTVPKGNERLRICLHAFNTKEEMNSILKILKEHG